MKSVVILGGYGNFGRRIAAGLMHEPNTRVFIAGRNFALAREVASEIGAPVEPLRLDARALGLADTLKSLETAVLIHTVGPFQGQSYEVAQSCIAAGCHYVDIADGREYVAHIDRLNPSARAREVLIVSGASSLPALSSAVVDTYRDRFERIDSIEYAISSGAKPPGVATMQGVFSYVGKPFDRWQSGTWKTVFGWQDARRYRFPAPVGRRWVTSCDVPDLELFPARFAPVQSVVFRAGIGFSATTFAVWALSWLVRARMIKSLSPYAEWMHRAALLIEPYGTKWSAMRIRISGVDKNLRPIAKTWTLSAGDNDGPNIPCSPAIALTRKLLRDQVAERGAMPCMGLLDVDEILRAIPDLNIRVSESDS